MVSIDTMLKLSYFGTYPYGRLCSITCWFSSIGCDGQDRVWYQNNEDLKQYLADAQTDIMLRVIGHIRIREYDMDSDIWNRYAYTSIVMSWKSVGTREKLVEVILDNARIIQWLRKTLGDSEKIDAIERVLWRSIPEYYGSWLKQIARKFLQNWSASRAQIYLQPDYIWRIGDRKGKRTVDWIRERISI